MLTHKIAIYIPSTVNGNQPAPADMIDRWVRASKIKMANLFGGFTSYQAHGGWFSPEHGLIEESVTIVQAFTDPEGLTKLDKVNDLAKEIAADMSQEIVSVEVDGTLNFVTV
jgi:hypothetical protein